MISIASFFLGAALCGICFYKIHFKPLNERALQWHIERDHAVRDLEIAKFEKQTFEQRCEFLTALVSKREAEIKVLSH